MTILEQDRLVTSGGGEGRHRSPARAKRRKRNSVISFIGPYVTDSR